MLLSIVICTRNRSKLLRECLESLKESTQNVDCEVIVVDNGSTDDTSEVSSSFSAIRVFEPKIGLSVARNKGLTVATGELIAFLDDDVRVSAGWAQAMVRAFDEAAVAVVAGRVMLRWRGPRPSWMTPELEGWYSACDYGERARWFEHEDPVGANMAFRRCVLTEKFDESLGRTGEQLLGGEESELVRRLRRTGSKVLYAPDAWVEHQVPESRGRLSWLCARVWAQGVSSARIRVIEGGSDVHVETARAISQAIVRNWRGSWRRLRTQPLPNAIVADAVTRLRWVSYAVALQRGGK